MKEYRLQAINQLPALLKSFKKKHKLTQENIGVKLNLSQRNYARFEGNPSRASFESVFNARQKLSVDIVFRERR